MSKHYLERFLKPLACAERLEQYARNKTQHTKERRTLAFKTAQRIRAANQHAE